MSVCEVLGKVTVCVGTGLCLVQEFRRNATVSELILDLVDFDLKLSPFPIVKAE